MPTDSLTVEALLLAGGRAHRIGSDKRVLNYRGRPLIARALEVAQTLTPEVRVLVSDSRGRELLASILDEKVRFTLDPMPGCGPMAALMGALPEVQADYAFLLAADYPLLTGKFVLEMKNWLGQMGGCPDVLVPRCEGIAQVTCAFYRPSLVASLKESFQNGERSLRGWCTTVDGKVEYLSQQVWEKWGSPEVFFDVDTPQDYQQLVGVH